MDLHFPLSLPHARPNRFLPLPSTVRRPTPMNSLPSRVRPRSPSLNASALPTSAKIVTSRPQRPQVIWPQCAQQSLCALQHLHQCVHRPAMVTSRSTSKHSPTIQTAPLLLYHPTHQHKRLSRLCQKKVKERRTKKRSVQLCVVVVRSRNNQVRVHSFSVPNLQEICTWFLFSACVCVCVPL